MKLFLIWLLGVPVAVTSMVTVQSLMESQHLLKSSAHSDALRVEMLREHADSTTPGKE
jgi:hypothetical protein